MREIVGGWELVEVLEYASSFSCFEFLLGDWHVVRTEYTPQGSCAFVMGIDLSRCKCGLHVDSLRIALHAYLFQGVETRS